MQFLKKISIFALLGIFLVLSACSDSSPTQSKEVDGPFISILELEKKDQEPGKFARLLLKVKNTGNQNAFEVKWSTRFVKDNVHVGTISGSLGEIEVGGEAEKEIILSTIAKHEDYSKVTVSLTWENFQKFEYARTYSE
jgi:hypothetical protein